MILIPKYRDSVKLVGNVSIIVTNTITDTVKQELYIPNTVVLSGKTWIAARIANSSSGLMTHMGIGSSDQAVNASTDSTLVAEFTGQAGYARAALTGGYGTPSGTAVTYSAQFAAGNPTNTSNLKEAGIFTASSGGTMLARTIFATISKAPADAISITWTITLV